MLKCAQNELLPSIEKLFDSCLSNGNYPKNWAVGYITPIHVTSRILTIIGVFQLQVH